MNRLSGEKSAYLKHSARQKIDWYPWSDEAFEKAREEDRPVFLSSGAIWCHWCHVMAKESFEDTEVVNLLNENFINIKLDRDERPDIDRRYQQAVAAMGSGGGWPLSIFLTPDRKPFFGGTYFPPEDSSGRPGFKKVLRAVADFYKSKRDEVNEYSGKLLDSLRHRPMQESDIKKSLLDDAVESIISEADLQNGGFGSTPKFPMPGAMEFLIGRHFFEPKESVSHIIRKTLGAMAKGGFHDQIGGGFHRYSTDTGWIIPHFEKMADDNAWLLRNYINAYRIFGSEHFKEVSQGIIRFLRNELSDPEGGFYASMDADVTPDDEGGYFTWTDEDFRKLLNDEEYKVLSMHLLHERGSMHHDSSKRVLFVSMEPEGISKETGIEPAGIAAIIKTGKEKLLSARNRREKPFIDRSFYTSLNAMLIGSYLNAYRALSDTDLRDFALLTAEKIMRERFINNELFHSDGVKGLLDDYIYMADALVEAYEITGNRSYLDRGSMLMKICIKKFWDEKEGGFFDTGGEVIGLRLKAIEDIPHPSANALGIILMLKLSHLAGEKAFGSYAEKALRVFSSGAKDMGISTGYYFSALDAYFNQMKLTVHSSPGSELADAAVSIYRPYTSIAYAEDRGYILPCIGTECYEPLYSRQGIEKFIAESHSKSPERP